MVDGGPEVGAHLAHHQDVDRVHMTGSAATYDALVWGTGPEAERRRTSGQRLLAKPFTAELGGVGPMIVAPGRWTRHDVRRQADRIAYCKLQNSGHSCAATQILVLPEGWDQADLLLDDLREFLRTLEPRTPYYPGSDARVARALADQDHVETLGPDGRRFLVTGLDPDQDCSLFSDEVFADVLGVVRLPAPDVESYLARAVGFANEALTGSLGATLLVDPDTESHHRQAVTERRGRTALRGGRPERARGLQRRRAPAALGRLPRQPARDHRQRSRLRQQHPATPPARAGRAAGRLPDTHQALLHRHPQDPTPRLQGLHRLDRLRRQPPQDPQHRAARTPGIGHHDSRPPLGTQRRSQPPEDRFTPAKLGHQMGYARNQPVEIAYPIDDPALRGRRLLRWPAAVCLLQQDRERQAKDQDDNRVRIDNRSPASATSPALCPRVIWSAR